MEVATAAPSGNADPAPPQPPSPDPCADPNPLTPWPCDGSMFGNDWGDWGAKWLIYDNADLLPPDAAPSVLTITATPDTPSQFVEAVSPEFAASGTVDMMLHVVVGSGGYANVTLPSGTQWIYSDLCESRQFAVPAGAYISIAARAGADDATVVRIINATGTEHFGCE